jgi:hypothetical protein
MGKSTHSLFFFFLISDAVSKTRKVNLRKQIAAKGAAFQLRTVRNRVPPKQITKTFAFADA